jgi:hypothetical protein
MIFLNGLVTFRHSSWMTCVGFLHLWMVMLHCGVDQMQCHIVTFIKYFFPLRHSSRAMTHWIWLLHRWPLFIMVHYGVLLWLDMVNGLIILLIVISHCIVYQRWYYIVTFIKGFVALQHYSCVMLDYNIWT